MQLRSIFFQKNSQKIQTESLKIQSDRLNSFSAIKKTVVKGVGSGSGRE